MTTSAGPSAEMVVGKANRILRNLLYVGEKMLFTIACLAQSDFFCTSLLTGKLTDGHTHGSARGLLKRGPSALKIRIGDGMILILVPFDVKSVES